MDLRTADRVTIPSAETAANTRLESATHTIVICQPATMITTHGVWHGDNPLNYSLPIFILQLCLVLFVTRSFVFLLKPLRQPRVIAEIMAGIFLGPSLVGRSEAFASNVFPLRSITVLETVANIGLIYFHFLVGVEMDIGVIRRTGKKALVIAIAGMILPFITGTSASFFLRDSISKNVEMSTFLVFLGVALSITAFPVLARILSELKLLNSEIGRIAMSSGIINDLIAWVLLALAIALSEDQKTTFASLYVIVSGLIFVLFCMFAVRPAVDWVARKTPEGEAVHELYVCLLLAGALVSSFITDAIGIHAIFGAFVFGLIVPNGPLGAALIQKLEDFVAGMLLPLYFVMSGLRTDVRLIKDMNQCWLLVLIIFMAGAGKTLGTLIVAVFYNMPFREGLSLGLLMNTKGLVEMIVLNIGRDRQVLDEPSFAVLVITEMIMTSLVMPVVTAIYQPARRNIPYKRRTIQRSKPDSELRLMVCIHNPRNVPTIINLIEASYPTKKSPICVYSLHLLELTGRASAMVIVHNERKSTRPTLNHGQAHSDHIVSAFENYEQHSNAVSIQMLTAISPYSTMHEDICNLAEDKRVALIIVPFHKQQAVDGGMEPTNPAFRTVNQNVLANSPCSVGILIDRGLGGTTMVSASHVSHHVAVLFFGGPDDREALSYASRMVEHPGISLMVIRFLPGEDAVEPTVQPNDSKEAKILTIITENERKKQLDHEFINEFRLRNLSNESIVYKELVVNNGEETMAAMRSMDTINDLYIVGRGQGMISPLTAGLADWSECPELGAIGDLLASSDFAATVSVLVIQQYVGVIPVDGVGTPDSPAQQMEQYRYNNNERSRAIHDLPHRPGDYPSGWN